MELALSAANYLSPIANALLYLNTTTVHPVWFPYPLATTLHAMRVSMGFQSNARRSPTPLSWGTYLTGFLMMAWGGGILSHIFLGVPPPVLYSFHPYINYLSVHLVFTLVFWLFPDLLNLQVLDTILWPLDTLLRTNGVTSLLGLLDNPNVHPEYQNSPLTHLIVGAIVSSGGGLVVGTFDAWSPNWTFNTPPMLRAGAGWTGTLDVWGGALVALIYSSTTSHKAFTSLHTYSTLLLSSPPFSVTRKPHADADFPPLSSHGAKSLAGAVLGLLFAARVIKTHWLPAEAVDTMRAKAVATQSKKAKKKTQ